MSAIVHGVRVLFGIPKDEDLPKIPKGFSFIKNAKDWLFAIDEKQEQWFVGKDELVRCGFATEEEVVNSKWSLSLGQRFYDNRTIIKFNPETGEVIQ